MADDKEKGDEQELVTLAADLKKATEEQTKKSDETKKTAETALAETKNLGKITDETKGSVDKLLTESNEAAEKLKAITARLQELEQKGARRGSEDHHPQLKDLGDLVAEHDTIKALTSSWRGQTSVKLNTKDIMNVVGTVGSATSPANSLISSFRVPGLITPPERKMTIRDLIPGGRISTNMLEYPKENVATNNARVQSEGATKGKSDLTFTMATAPVRTIATYFKASRQILDDAPLLASYINARGRYFVLLAEENELLKGDGTGQHIYGLVPQSTAYSANFTPTNPTIIDTVRLAMLQVMLSEFPATGVVLNPIDWGRVETTKDTQGRYIMGNPAGSIDHRLWGLPVVETQAMNVDEFLVGAFNLAAQIFDRMDIEVMLSTENEDDFIKNLVTIRIEERLALAVYRPLALVHGDFGNVT